VADDQAELTAQLEKQAGLALANTTLRDALQYYEDNRNCAPIGKTQLNSILNRHVSDCMSVPILNIDATMLQVRYKKVHGKVTAHGAARAARDAKRAAGERLLLAPEGYFNGIKTAHDVVEGIGRVYRYWVTKHMAKLQRAGVLVSACPTAALMDDLMPAPQRVKSLPTVALRQLLGSFHDYPDNALHPLLVRFLLATGICVGIAMNCKMEFIKKDRIVIPADTERSKVRWKERHLEHMAFIVPLTSVISQVLEEIAHVAPIYGESKTWLFPSRSAESGHMVEERAVTLRLRKHSGVRFTMHQFRHNVASAAEELGYRKSEIAELLGHTQSTVTDRYIDERITRQRKMLMSVNARLSQMVSRASTMSPV
jgi:integrase